MTLIDWIPNVVDLTTPGIDNWTLGISASAVAISVISGLLNRRVSNRALTTAQNALHTHYPRLRVLLNGGGDNKKYRLKFQNTSASIAIEDVRFSVDLSANKHLMFSKKVDFETQDIETLEISSADSDGEDHSVFATKDFYVASFCDDKKILEIQKGGKVLTIRLGFILRKLKQLYDLISRKIRTRLFDDKYQTIIEHLLNENEVLNKKEVYHGNFTWVDFFYGILQKNESSARSFKIRDTGLEEYLSQWQLDRVFNQIRDGFKEKIGAKRFRNLRYMYILWRVEINFTKLTRRRWSHYVCIRAKWKARVGDLRPGSLKKLYRCVPVVVDLLDTSSCAGEPFHPYVVAVTEWEVIPIDESHSYKI